MAMPVIAPGSTPDVSIPGNNPRPVAHARALMMIHQPARWTSLRRTIHCALPTTAPSTTPARTRMSGGTATRAMAHPAVQPAKLARTQCRPRRMWFCRTTHWRMPIAMPDAARPKGGMRSDPRSQPAVVTMIHCSQRPQSNEILSSPAGRHASTTSGEQRPSPGRVVAPGRSSLALELLVQTGPACHGWTGLHRSYPFTEPASKPRTK